MVMTQIRSDNMDIEAFIDTKVREIRESVGDGLAVAAVSGGVDSATAALLGHRALGDRLRFCFVDTGLLREGEAERVVREYRSLSLPIEKISADEEFFGALAGNSAPEAKVKAAGKVFYETLFAPLLGEGGAEFLLQGTTLTDIEETVAGVRRQHSVLEQMGNDPRKKLGFQLIEPLADLPKSAVRQVAHGLGLPDSICQRAAFPGLGLAMRVVGEVTRERVEMVRTATRIIEEELQPMEFFQCLAILHKDRVTGIRSGKRELGCQIEVRCWDSEDGTEATPTALSQATLRRLGRRLTSEIPGVMSATYNIAEKPPSTIEAV